MTPSEP